MAARPFGVRVGSVIRARRIALEMSQRDLAGIVGMSVPRLNDLERGRRPDGPGYERLLRLAVALNMSAEDLVDKASPSRAA